MNNHNAINNIHICFPEKVTKQKIDSLFCGLWHGSHVSSCNIVISIKLSINIWALVMEEINSMLTFWPTAGSPATILKGMMNNQFVQCLQSFKDAGYNCNHNRWLVECFIDNTLYGLLSVIIIMLDMSYLFDLFYCVLILHLGYCIQPCLSWIFM